MDLTKMMKLQWGTHKRKKSIDYALQMRGIHQGYFVCKLQRYSYVAKKEKKNDQNINLQEKKDTICYLYRMC